MKKYIILFLATGIAFNSFAQEKINWHTIRPYVNGVAQASSIKPDDNRKGNWGLVDKQGNTILEPTFDYMLEWQEGMARVLLRNSVGYINMKGEIVVPLKRGYINGDYNSGFVNGFALVRSYSGFGFINKKGEEVIPTKYSFAGKFNKYGYAIVFEDMGWETYTDGYKYPTKTEQTKCAAVDTLGNEVVKMGEYDDIKFANNGCFVVTHKTTKKYGVIGNNGQIILPLIYDYAYVYEENGAIRIEVELNGRKFIVDKNGTKIKDN